MSNEDPYEEYNTAKNLGTSDYKEVKKFDLLNTDKRWETGVGHHPESIRLMHFLSEYDYHNNGDYFGWKLGGDGDNGEELMYQMDAYFEIRAKLKNKKS